MKQFNELTATDLANCFLEMWRQETLRVSYKGGVRQGDGAVPYDTGALMQSAYLSKSGNYIAQVTIGNADIDYGEFLEFAEKLKGGKPNMHKGFVEKLLTEYFPQYIRNKYGFQAKKSKEV